MTKILISPGASGADGDRDIYSLTTRGHLPSCRARSYSSRLLKN